MLRKFGTDWVWVGVPSAGRTDHVAKTHDLIGPVTWYVPPGEEAAYAVAGAAVALRPDRSTDTVTLARNDVLEDAFKCDVMALIVDDDMTEFKRAWTGKFYPLTFYEMVNEMRIRLKFSDFMAAASAYSFNAYWVTKQVSLCSIVDGSFVLSKPNPIRFDEQFVVHESADFSLQHIREYGGVMRNNDLMAFYKHMHPGGALLNRSEDERIALEDEMKILYAKKWGNAVLWNGRVGRLNPHVARKLGGYNVRVDV